MRNKIKPWDHVEADESGDEQWIVSYADMVTLLFGFFVILYSFSTFDEKKFDQMGEKLASAFKAPEDLDKKTASEAGITTEARQIRALQLLVAMMNLGENMDQALNKIEHGAMNESDVNSTKEMLKEKLKEQTGISMIKSKSIDPSVVELVLPEKILFQSGQAELSLEAQKNIQKLGKDLLRINDIDKIEVVGHTDSSPPGKTSLFKTNFTLSSARAGAVAQELMKSGLPAELFSVKGMADLEPLTEAVDKTAAKGNTKSVVIPQDPTVNRRVHIVLRKVRHE